MKIKKTRFKDLFIIKQSDNIDNRGSLRETFNDKILKKKFVFEYCTTSKKNVFRGFTFKQKIFNLSMLMFLRVKYLILLLI